MAERRWWVIDITGYGSFAFFGTKAEADAVTRAKATWEGGQGMYHSVERGHERVVHEVDFLRKTAPSGFSHSQRADPRQIAMFADIAEHFGPIAGYEPLKDSQP